ncbi:MAG: M1 family metallopeptidase [Candidatus Coproplasma sp.]
MKKTCLIFAAAAISLAALPLSACRSGAKQQSDKYEIIAAYSEEDETLTGTCTFTFFNRTDNEIDDLCFNIWGNAYREGATYKPVASGDNKAYYSGVNYGGESVDKVEGCESWEVCGEDENILQVRLVQPLYPDQSTTVTISYTLDFARVNHRTGVTATGVNLGNFYPVLCAYTKEGFIQTPYYSTGDPFVSDCADYDVTFTLPLGYAAATSGKEVERKEEKEGTSVRYVLENARDFAAVISKNFKTATQSVNGCEVTAYYCGDRQIQNELNAVCESLEYFSSTFGEYAYPTLSVVFTPLNSSGMEYPALTMINSALTETDAIYTAVHETAHQWWYAMVGNDQVKNAWQDEGLAEYSTLAFFETHPAYGYTRTALLGSAIKTYRAYYSVYNQIFGKSDTTMNRSLKDYEGEYEYVNIAYNKSLLMFESVRTAMGDKKFFTALSNYFKNNKFTVASPEALIAEFDKLYDVEGIICGYLDGKVVI